MRKRFKANEEGGYDSISPSNLVGMGEITNPVPMSDVVIPNPNSVGVGSGDYSINFNLDDDEIINTKA